MAETEAATPAQAAPALVASAAAAAATPAGALPEEKTIAAAPEKPAVEPEKAEAVVEPADAAADEPEKVAPTAAAAAPPASSAAVTAATTPAQEASKPAAATSEADQAETPFAQFVKKLPVVVKEVGHDEMWGVSLPTTTAEGADVAVPVAVVVQKFLNANDGDLSLALQQFTGALKFRKEKKPLELLAKTFSATKFGNLGAVTVYPGQDGAVPEVFTWNLYGNVKDSMDDVFVPLNEFMDYRIALQELGIKQLNLAAATERITETRDPYKIIQVHDYKGISFFRQNANVKAASAEVIKQFALAYPELLKEKFFVNVPAIMGWLYGIMKLFVAEKTRKKFHPMANGANLAAEFQAGPLDQKQLPKEYGGDSGDGSGSLKGVAGLVDTLAFS